MNQRSICRRKPGIKTKRPRQVWEIEIASYNNIFIFKKQIGEEEKYFVVTFYKGVRRTIDAPDNK
jgi:hypothetical protein